MYGERVRVSGVEYDGSLGQMLASDRGTTVTSGVTSGDKDFSATGCFTF